MKKLILSLSVLTLTVQSLLDATITIQTSDGQEIEFSGMQEQALLQSETIKNIFDDLEEDDSIIPLPEISAATFETVMTCLELLHQSKECVGEDKKKIEQELAARLDQLTAEHLIKFMQAVSYLSVSEFLAVSSNVWNEKYALEYFENNATAFDNREIIDTLKTNCLPSLQSFFISQYLKHFSPQSKTLEDHNGDVNSVCYSPDNTKIASGSSDNTVRIWDTTTGEFLHTLAGHKGMVWSACYSPDNTKIASGSGDKTVRIWDAATGECLHILKGHGDKVWSVCFNPDGKKIASGSNDHTVRIWDTTTGECLHKLKGHKYGVYSVCYSPCNTKIASGSDDDTVHIWDATIRKCLHILKGHNNRVYSVCYSPDNAKLASSGSSDNTVRIWDASTGECLHTLAGHNNSVRSVCYSPNNTKIASGSDDKTVRIWDATTRECLHILKGHNSWINSVCYSPDNTKIVSGSWDLTVRIWDIAGPANEMPNHSYEQLILHALCKEKIENNQTFELRNTNLLKTFSSLSSEQQDFLRRIAGIELSFQNKLLLKMHNIKKAIGSI